MLMQTSPDRAVLTVTRQHGVWIVAQDGEHVDQSPDKEVAKASAHKRARQLHDSGRACQVRVLGEHGFWAAP
jgi:hypothetical protein